MTPPREPDIDPRFVDVDYGTTILDDVEAPSTITHITTELGYRTLTMDVKAFRVSCPACHSDNVTDRGYSANGRHLRSCATCGMTFSETYAVRRQFTVYRSPSDPVTRILDSAGITPSRPHPDAHDLRLMIRRVLPVDHGAESYRMIIATTNRPDVDTNGVPVHPWVATLYVQPGSIIIDQAFGATERIALATLAAIIYRHIADDTTGTPEHDDHAE